MLNILQGLFEESTIFSPADSGQGTPLCAKVSPSPDSSCKIAIVVGSNASGKSLATRLLATWLKSETPAIEPLLVSMRGRTEGGMARCFMYSALGEALDSTGANSMVAVQGALSTAASRTSPCWVLLDEPDVGLSEDFAQALGEYLAQQAMTGLTDSFQGLIIVTHSRSLVKGLTESLPYAPHFVHVDEQPAGLQQWLAGKQRRTVEELLNLSTKSLQRYRDLNTFFGT